MDDHHHLEGREREEEGTSAGGAGAASGGGAGQNEGGPAAAATSLEGAEAAKAAGNAKFAAGSFAEAAVRGLLSARGSRSVCPRPSLFPFPFRPDSASFFCCSCQALYGEALTLAPAEAPQRAAFYANRAACHLKLGRFQEARAPPASRRGRGPSAYCSAIAASFPTFRRSSSSSSLARPPARPFFVLFRQAADDCTAALAADPSGATPSHAKALHRRATARESLEDLEGALADWRVRDRPRSKAPPFSPARG